MRRFHTHNLLFALIVTATLFIPAAAQETNGNAAKRSHSSPLKLTLPNKDGSVRFAVIGDTGSGSSKQRRSRSHDDPVSCVVSVRVCLDDGRQYVRR